jgi:hypothetical protein
MWRVVPSATFLASVWFGSGPSWPVEMLLHRVARSSSSSSQEHNAVAMALHGRHEPLRLSRKDGLPQPAFDFQILPSFALHCTNPLSPPSTTSSAKPGPLPAFTPPLWLLYLCRSLEAEIATCQNFQPNSPRQASTASTRREANSPSIPPRQRKHRKHFHSIANRKSRLIPETSTDIAFE